MIEKLVTSKTRIKILKLFLSHIDDRYYLRELERLLDESLSPLRRQLLKLTSIGILMVEEDANLKYYRLDKNFEGMEELKNMILGRDVIARSSDTNGVGTTKQSQKEIASLTSFARNDIIAKPNDIYVGNGFKPFPTRQFRYDLALLSFISVFVLITAVFVVYANNKNIKQVASLINRSNNTSSAKLAKIRSTTPASNGEMASRKWKVMPGNIPVLSSGEIGEEKNSKEL